MTIPLEACQLLIITSPALVVTYHHPFVGEFLPEMGEVCALSCPLEDPHLCARSHSYLGSTNQDAAYFCTVNNVPDKLRSLPETPVSVSWTLSALQCHLHLFDELRQLLWWKNLAFTNLYQHRLSVALQVTRDRSLTRVVKEACIP